MHDAGDPAISIAEDEEEMTFRSFTFSVTNAKSKVKSINIVQGEKSASTDGANTEELSLECDNEWNCTIETSITGEMVINVVDTAEISHSTNVKIVDWSCLKEDIKEDGHLDIPDGIITLNDKMFTECVLDIKNITIPSSVKNIETQTFDDMTSLTSFEVNSENEMFTTGNDALYSKDKNTLVRYPLAKNR